MRTKRRFNHPAAQTDRADFILSHLDLDAATGEAGASYNSCQLGLLNTPDSVLVSADNKARQLGWSWAAAADAVAQSILVPGSNSIFVSYNLEEAKEKVEYAKRIIRALRPDVRPGLDGDTIESLRLENGSRLASLPCREPRGRGKPRVYLDEYAMYGPNDRAIYIAAVGACGRGGVVRIGSTPKPTGMFRELLESDAATDVQIVTREYPWWIAPHLARDIQSAVHNAPEMTTEQRVERYGTDHLKTIYAQYMAAGDPGGFAQEYECAFISESAALIPTQYVRDAKQEYITGDIPAGASGLIAIGADFALKQDRTEYVVVLFEKGNARVVDHISQRGVDRAQQTETLDGLINKWKPSSVCGDVTDGHGRGVIADLAAIHPFVQPVDFSGGRAAELAQLTAGYFYNHKITIPADDTLLAGDVESVRKVQKATGHTRYETRRTSKGHGDSFWALALALYALPRDVCGDFQYRPVSTRPVNWSGPSRAGSGPDFNMPGSDVAVDAAYGSWRMF